MLKNISLVGEQRKVLTLNSNGPILIKGAAGSGKTTVSVYRACHLMDSHGDMFEPSKVAIFTFNKTLSGYLNDLVHSTDGKSYNNVSIINFHKWAYNFIVANGHNIYGKTIDSRDIQEIIRGIVNNISINTANKRILSKSIDFFSDEISWIKGKDITNMDDYFRTSRVGRGNVDRVLKTDKNIIWEIFVRYQEELKRLAKYDFDDYALLCLKIIDQKGNDFTQPYTHIVIDEAQDLNKSQVSVLSKLVSPSTNSITIVADAAQRIYKSGFSWKEVGLNVTGGRAIEFKKNYRNTVAIAKAALSLLENDNDSEEFTKVELGNVLGEKPLLKKFFDINKEQLFIVEKTKLLRKANPLDTICILHRSHSGLKRIIGSLERANLEIEKINNNSNINYFKPSIKISTMQSVKGLEFDHIIISNINDENLPLKSGFSYPDDDLHITTERRLLYTCMTRAVKSLTITCNGRPSRYLNEIDSHLLEE